MDTASRGRSSVTRSWSIVGKSSHVAWRAGSGAQISSICRSEHGKEKAETVELNIPSTIEIFCELDFPPTPLIVSMPDADGRSPALFAVAARMKLVEAPES
jgi:hypothetical protein